MPGKSNRAAYQFKVELRGIQPPIWRRIRVWEDATLAQLHCMLQMAMGWEDYHLHEFRVGRKICGVRTRTTSAKSSMSSVPVDAEALLQKILSMNTFPRKERIRIKPNEPALLELNERERELILSQTLADESLTDRLRVVPKQDERPLFSLHFGELDELAGCAVAEANHSKDKKLRKLLDQLFARIEDTLATNSVVVSTHSARRTRTDPRLSASLGGVPGLSSIEVHSSPVRNCLVIGV